MLFCHVTHHALLTFIGVVFYVCGAASNNENGIRRKLQLLHCELPAEMLKYILIRRSGVSLRYPQLYRAMESVGRRGSRYDSGR